MPESGPRLQRTETVSAAFTATAGCMEVRTPNSWTGACGPTSAGMTMPKADADPAGDTPIESRATITSEGAREATCSEKGRLSPIARSVGAWRATWMGGTTRSAALLVTWRAPSATDTSYAPGASVSGSVASMTPSARSTGFESCTGPIRTESASAAAVCPPR